MWLNSIKQSDDIRHMALNHAQYFNLPSVQGVTSTLRYIREVNTTLRMGNESFGRFGVILEKFVERTLTIEKLVWQEKMAVIEKIFSWLCGC